MYFNTAAVGSTIWAVAEAYEAFLNEWVTNGFDYVRGEAAAENARSSVAAPHRHGAGECCVDRFCVGGGGLGGRAASPGPFRNGGLEPEEIAKHVDARRLVAFSGVQSATGHRSDITGIAGLAREVEAIVFVDASQMLGAVPLRDQLGPDHKFLMHAGRGLGYCYLSPRVRDEFIPINAGWKAAAVPLESFFGPAMELSSTASRFDNSISWLAAVGNEAALSAFEEFGLDAIHRRNAELATLLRSALNDAGWPPVPLPAANQSSIVSVPLRDHDASKVVGALRERRIVCAVRDGNLRLAIHFYNHEDDVDRLIAALTEI